MVKLSTIRAEIARKGILQHDLAVRLGVSDSLVSKALNGRRDKPEMLQQIWEMVQGESR